MNKIITLFLNLYPVWILGVAVAGLLHPPLFIWFKGPWIEGAIALVMLAMGFTLTLDDFRYLFKIPGACALGFVCQYTAMPLLGWSISRVLHLESGLTVGLILVASCPGGIASNVIAYLAKANVALSVVLTAVSTLTAFVFTPLWCKTLAGMYVEVDAWGICLSTFRVVVIPVLLGVFSNWRFPKIIAKLSPASAPLSVVAIVLITGGVIALNAEKVLQHIGLLIIAVTLLHSGGYAIGYLVSRVLGYDTTIARTAGIEVGMQNGGMAAMLANKHFAAVPLAGVPAVLSGVMQNLLASVLVSTIRWIDKNKEDPQ